MLFCTAYAKRWTEITFKSDRETERPNRKKKRPRASTIITEALLRPFLFIQYLMRIVCWERHEKLKRWSRIQKRRLKEGEKNISALISLTIKKKMKWERKTKKRMGSPPTTPISSPQTSTSHSLVLSLGCHYFFFRFLPRNWEIPHTSINPHVCRQLSIYNVHAHL